MRPREVGRAGLFLMWAAIVSIVMSLGLASATMGCWCTSWTYGPLVSFLCLVTGASLAGLGPSTGLRGAAHAVCVLELGQLVNLDPFGPMFALAALFTLQSAPVRAWFAGTWQPPQQLTLEDEQPGLLLKTTFLPLSLVMHASAPKVRIDGEKREVVWGNAAFALSPGPHTIEVSVPFLVGALSPTELEVEVPESGAVGVKYYTPGFIGLPGKLERTEVPTKTSVN